MPPFPHPTRLPYPGIGARASYDADAVRITSNISHPQSMRDGNAAHQDVEYLAKLSFQAPIPFPFFAIPLVSSCLCFVLVSPLLRLGLPGIEPGTHRMQ